jgi:hypothetical protein
LDGSPSSGTGNAASPSESSNSSGGTYWKAAGFSEEGFDTDEYTADIFLWEGGKGHFRFVQGEGGGFRETFDCNWTLADGTLTLNTGSKSGDRIQGTIAGNHLTLCYNNLVEGLTIIMEQAPLLPYGAQWDVSDLFGSWRMVSYTDHYRTAVSGNGIFTPNNSPHDYVYSELSIYTTLGVNYRLECDFSEFLKAYSDLSMKRVNGTLWKDCPN